MTRDLNTCERRYKKTIGAIGVSLLLFLALFYLGDYGMDFFLENIVRVPLSGGVIVLIAELVYALFYVICFTAPVFLLKALIKNDGYAFYTMRAEPRISGSILPMIFVVVFIARAASYLNYDIVTLFQKNEFSYITGGGVIPLRGYQIVLRFMVSCIIPGFFEELFFRGAILTNCLPFGRSNAILISALLFALMHENPMQMLFTFVGGILIGLIYVRTKSIWSCVIVHVLNNFFSLIDDVINHNFSQSAAVLLAIAEAILCVLGVISLAYLLIRYFSKKTTFEKGIYGTALPACDSYASCPVDAPRALRLFLTPSMVAFCALTVCSMIVKMFS